MKKFLFSSFLSLLGLLALGSFFLGSDVNAAACPDTDPTCNDGICGTADGSIYWNDNMPADSAPNFDVVCLNGGNTTPVRSYNHWSWKCTGNSPDGNDSQTCTTQPVPVTGICGSANGQSYFGAPYGSALCDISSPLVGSQPSGSGPWSWVCRGASTNTTCNAQVDTRTFSWEISSRGACYESTTSSGICSGTYQVPGVCGNPGQKVAGSIGYDGSPDGPHEGWLCSTFTTENTCYVAASPWVNHPCNWRPDGYRTESCEDLGSSSSCNANAGCSRNASQNPTQTLQNRTVVCKDNNGNTVADAFCSHPKPPITQTGTPATCNTTPVNGVCSTTENSCSVGSVANYNPTTHTWSCIGSNGGTTASCSTSIQGTCGSANGGSFTSIPTTNLCGTGSPSSVAGSGPWTWSCNGMNGGSSASCSATKSIVPVDGVCGLSNNQSTSAFPSAGLCTVGTPVIGVMTPDGSNNFTWSCQGIYGGTTASCQAPYVPMACVPYNPTTNGPTNSIANGTEMSIVLNAPTNEITDSGRVRLTQSSSYSFTGILSPTTYLKVNFTNLASTTQSIQYVQSHSIKGKIGAGEFFGCEARGWEIDDPLLRNYNFKLQNIGMMADNADLIRGWIQPLSHPLHDISAFLAWDKAQRGFRVNCEVCPITTPVNTRTASCTNLPIHAIPNTVSIITQTDNGGIWSPSDIFAYNTVASTSECRFICEDNYTWDGSACIADTKTAFCLGTIPANALQNGPSSYIQTRNGSDRTPSGFTWNHNTSPNTCNFICKGGYNRNGNACVQNIAYAWEIGTRSVCSNNLQTRTVVCKNSYGNTVADNLCPAPKPATSQAASCPPVGACGGYGHVYVKEINRVNTKDINYPGDSACNIGVPQREKEDTCTYGFYSDTAGTLPINVSNLNVSISSVATYGNSTYINTISGLTFTQVCKTEESLDFPPAACAKYQENDISVVDNSCVTVIAGGGPSQPVCGATEGSCLVGTVDGRDSSFPPNQPWYCVQGANVAECAMPAQCGTRYGSYMFPTGTSAMPTDSPILCKYGSANPVPTLYGGNQVTSFTAWTCNGLDANSSVACTGSIGCQYILNGSPQTCG